jgi:polar amino acid transport system substrate-binding protein
VKIQINKVGFRKGIGRALVSVMPLGFVLNLMAVQAVQAQDKPTPRPIPMRLATLEWPPYTGLLLPQEGISTRVAKVVARSAGYNLMSAYFEWTETMEKGEKGIGFDGYFPEYFTKERAQQCHLSSSIGTSLLGVATLRATPLYWKALPDLAAYKLGVVDGYSNGEVFDQAIKDKRQPVEAGASDAVNVKKLLDGRLRGIVIDRNVLNYTLSRTGGGDRIAFNAKPIAELTLHVCFRRTPEGKTMRDNFDTALKKADIVRLEADYLKSFRFAY